MGIFLVLAIYLVIIDLIVADNNRAAKSILAALGFVLVLALRSPYCGVDLLSNERFTEASYYSTFDAVKDMSFRSVYYFQSYSSFEIGFLFFTKIITLFTNNFQVFLVVIAVLQFIPIAFLFYKYSPNIILSYFVYGGLVLYLFSFSGLRQALAISICILAIENLFNKKTKFFILLVLLAYTFHRSSIIVFLIWPLSKIKMKPSIAISVVLFLLILSPFYGNILGYIVGFLFDNGRYGHYLETQGSAITMFVVYAILLLLSFLRKRDDDYMRLLRWLVLLCVFAQSLGTLGNGALTRIGYYFNIYFALLMPEMLATLEKNGRKITNGVSVILLCVYFYLVNSGGYLNVVPYYFFWEKPVL